MGTGKNIASTEHDHTDRDPAADAAHWYSLWHNSPSHYENMVHPSFTHVGVGIYYIRTGGMTRAYATTLFCVY